MRMTLLEIVQSVLSSMDSDNVNSLDDTIESSQVADVAKEVYYGLMSYNDWDHLYQWRELEGLSDNTKPNFLKIPENVGHLEIFRYESTNANSNGITINEVTYYKPSDFIDRTNSRTTTEDNVEVITNDNGVKMFIRNDKAPEYWTSFDNVHIVTDSYDNTVDASLQASKSSAWCRVQPEWSKVDTFIPELPIEFFPSYLAEVKSTCHLYFKQQLSQKDEQIARRGLAHVRRKERFDQGSNRVHYGRKAPGVSVKYC